LFFSLSFKGLAGPFPLSPPNYPDTHRTFLFLLPLYSTFLNHKFSTRDIPLSLCRSKVNSDKGSKAESERKNFTVVIVKDKRKQNTTKARTQF
jgi:hypothetical protein